MSNVEDKLNIIHNYIDDIKKYAYKDVCLIENQVLNKNPYTSEFISKYLFETEFRNPSLLFIIKKVSFFYIKSFIRFLLYLLSFILFKIKYKKKEIDLNKDVVVVDTFFLVDKIISEQKFNEKYFFGLYEVFEKHNIQYVFLPRLYGVNKNPFKILKLLDVLNKDNNSFIFEFEILSIKDIINIFVNILIYPFKTIRLLRKSTSAIDKLFNYEVINTLDSTPFSAYIRYLIGKRISTKFHNGTKIISWQEFQELEKTLNRAVRESDKLIKIYGCQFLIQYKNYISMYMTNTDYELNITPHETLLNGQVNYNLSTKQKYRNGVSLRYKNLYDFESINDTKDILVLLSYDIEESIYLLMILDGIEESIKVKIHPATKKEQFVDYFNDNMEFVDGNIYELLSNTKIVFVAPMSGTSLEAVACGVSVIIISNNSRLIMNPLVNKGKGIIWDIAFNKHDVNKLYNSILKYRKNNINKIEEIALWYRENFFIEPTEENIIKSFELDKE